MKVTELEIKSIRRDGDTQMRVLEVDPETVNAYAKDLEAGHMFPPITVFRDPENNYWLADGFETVAAAEKCEREKIRVDIRTGTLEDARWFAIGANKKHGLRRTNADKEKAIQAALKHPHAAAMSDRAIADHVGVSHVTVGVQRSELEATGQIDQSQTRKGADGRIINVTNIGKRKELEQGEVETVPDDSGQSNEIRQADGETDVALDPLEIKAPENHGEIPHLTKLLRRPDEKSPRRVAKSDPITSADVRRSPVEVRAQTHRVEIVARSLMQGKMLTMTIDGLGVVDVAVVDEVRSKLTSIAEDISIEESSWEWYSMELRLPVAELKLFREACRAEEKRRAHKQREGVRSKTASDPLCSGGGELCAE